MHPKIQEATRDISMLFNQKPKNGIAKITAICKEENIPLTEAIAEFFYQEKQNLDLESVGDYLSGPDEENKDVLQAFTRQLSFEGQSFVRYCRHEKQILLILSDF